MVRELVPVVAASIALAGCASVSGSRPVLGRLGASGGAGDAWSAEAVKCVGNALPGPGKATVVTFSEGGKYALLGAWLGTGIMSDGSSPPQIFVDAHRPHAPGLPAKLHREACARFEVAHHPQPDGSIGADVELDCTTDDGRRFVASLHAATCDRPPPVEGKL